MFKVSDVFKIGDKLSVTFEGNCQELKNGTKLKDDKGNIFDVLSIGMTRYSEPADISKSTTALITPCNIEKGSVLYSVNGL